MEVQTKNIHTTINQSLWLKAQLNNISWTNALEIGIRVLLNEEKTNEDIILEEIKELEKQRAIKQIQLKELREIQAKEEKTQDFDEKNYFFELNKKVSALKRLHPARQNEDKW